ncbi:hypothetical protein O181_033763 [Austropuccinia psidii MF-1]|uniref:Uncharacterized protein n=1 Tax=Austropuccinia psidii MF-1 TaxID=1389203 RepID=A0A9Q3H6R5_9BASI|nr:hypothetical protein [Austropuccinia psidii MF-1]
MSVSTRSKKAADDDADAKPLSNEEVYSLINSLRSEVQSLKSARSSDAAEVQSLRLQLSSPPPPGPNLPSFPRVNMSAYDRFMQEPYRAADRFNKLQGDGSNFPKWVASLNRVLCVAFNSEASIEDSPSLLDGRLPQENRAISHFFDASIPHDFALCIGVIPSRTTAKEFFDAIKARCCPGSRFHKLKVVRELVRILVADDSEVPRTNTNIVLSLRRTFAMFKKLGIDADELEGLLAQATCRPPPTLDQAAFDQLITAAILSKGEDKPASTFVGQVIINASQRGKEQARESSPFVYQLSTPQEPPSQYPRPQSPYNPRPGISSNEVRRPPNHLVDKFGASCFHCGRAGHWRADCPHTRGVANPNPRSISPGPSRHLRPGTPDRRSQQGSSSHYHRERVSQVQFVERDASDKVLIDTGASIHLSGAKRFATCIRSISPFRIFFADSNSSVLISQTTTLELPVDGGSVLVHDVAFSEKISGIILSVGRLCTAGVVPIFENLNLSLFVSGFLVTTTFKNNCWWLDVCTKEGTKRSAAASPSCILPDFEMNPISKPISTSLSSREWHERLGHACDKMVLSFLKQHVPSYDIKRWQPFYCEVCATAKSTHRQARARTDIPKSDPLDLLVSDIMGPFSGDLQGFRYLLTVRDHVSTYSVVYPLKARSKAPDAVLDAIRQLQVRLCLTPKALRTDNAKEFTSSLAKLGVSFFPSMPYSPQENGEAERLNRTLGDMARAMMIDSKMPDRFWRFAYASASFLHNRLPNSRCLHSSPHQVLFGQPPSISTAYPFGAEAIVHIPSVHQAHKLAPRGLACRLLKPLLSGGWLLWDPVGDRLIQSASVIFPKFQPTGSNDGKEASTLHVVNAAVVGQVPTKRYFKDELAAINTLSMTKDIEIPEHLGQALSCPLRHEWKKACERHADGSVEKFKARLVARGDRQRPGIDCTETYAPTASLMSLRLVLAHAACSNWTVSSFDVSGAYLYSPVKETVFLEPPTYFCPNLKGKALRLKKALYGMRQAGRCWWIFLSDILTRMGFTAMEVNQSLYIFRSGEDTIAIWIHVDDGVVASNSPKAVLTFKQRLCAEVDIKWHDAISQIVGLECAFGEGEVTIAQRRLTKSILDSYSRPVVKSDCPLPVLPSTVEQRETGTLDPTPFRSVIGSLAYLVSGSRPDLAFAVNYLARHSMAPTKRHWEILDNVVGYLLKTQHHRLVLQPGDVSLNLCTDAGWGGDLERSQTGFMLKLGDAPILWSSKRQGVVALSTCAAEYVALSDSTQHLVQAISQLSHLAPTFDKTIFCDNQAAVQVSIDNLSRKRMRYLDRAFFFVNDAIRTHNIKLSNGPSLSYA